VPDARRRTDGAIMDIPPFAGTLGRGTGKIGEDRGGCRGGPAGPLAGRSRRGLRE